MAGTLHASASRPQRTDSTAGKTRHVPKGHDRILDTAQRSGNALTVILSSGEQIIGKLVGRDKFTVTVQTDYGRRQTIFKHAIDIFYEDVPAKVEAGEGVETN